jgi:hypothetical protein
MERLKTCVKCSPHTEEILCVEQDGVRKKFCWHEDSAPNEMNSTIEECPELAIIEMQERQHVNGTNKSL